MSIEIMRGYEVPGDAVCLKRDKGVMYWFSYQPEYSAEHNCYTKIGPAGLMWGVAKKAIDRLRPKNK